MDDTVDESPPICEYCLRVFDEGDPIIECAECSQSICFCKTCFSYGVEGGEHRRGHNYRVHKQKTREIVKVDKRLGNWGFEDDMSLVVSTRLTKAANWPFLGEQIGFTGVPQALADHFDKYFIRGQIGQFARDFVELMRVICVEDSRWWTHFDFISDSLKFQVIVRSWMESSEEFDPFNVQAVIRNLFIFLQKKRLEFEAEKIDGKKKLKMKTILENLMATEQPKVEQRQPSRSITIKEELSIDVGHEPSDDSESFSPRRSTRQKTKSIEKRTRNGLRDRSSRRSIVEESESPPPSTSRRSRAKVEKVEKDEDSPRRRQASGVSTSSAGQPSPQINVDDDFQFVKPMIKEKRHEDTPSTPTIRSRKSSSVLKETIGPFDRLFIPCDCPNSFSSPISFCVRCGWSPGNGPHPYEPLWYIIERDNQVYVINTDERQREIRCKFVKDDQNSLRILADSFNEFPVYPKTFSRQSSIQNGEKKKKKEKVEKTVMLPAEERKPMSLQMKVKPLKLVRRADGPSTSWEPSPEGEIFEEDLKPMQKVRLKKGASQRLDQNLGKKGKITERRRTVEEVDEDGDDHDEEEDFMDIDEKDVGELITEIELPPVLEMMSPLRRRSSVRATSRDSSRRSETSHASKMEDDGMDDGEEETEDGTHPKRLRKMSRKMRESLYGNEENDEQIPEASPLSSPTANQSLPKLDPESSPSREKPSENAHTELEKFLEENEELDDPYAHLLDNVGPGWESNASDGDDDISACDEIKRGAIETSFDERTSTRRDSTGSRRTHNEITSHELNGDYWKPVSANREERNGRRGNRTLSPQNSLSASRGDSFDDLEVGVIPELNAETYPEERDSLISSDDGESGDEIFARRMKIPNANFIDQQPPFSVENNSSGKRNLHILKAASGIRPHWSSAVIGPAFARMKIDDSSKQSVEKVLRAVDVLHGWKKDEQEPIDVLECLTKPAPFPGRQIFAHLLSDSQRAGQALTGIPLSYVVKEDEEEDIQKAIYEGESDGGLSEMVKKTKWSDAEKIPRGVVGIGYKYTTSGDVCEDIVYPGDDQEDILFASTSGEKHKKLKMRANQVFVAGPQTVINQKPIVWRVEKGEKEINQGNRQIDETRRALIGSLLDFEGDSHYQEILFRYLENEKPKVPQNYQLDFKMTLDKKLNQVLFKFDSGLKASADLFEPSTSAEKVDEQPILATPQKSFANGHTPQKKPKKVLDESDDEETDSPPTKYRKTNSAKMEKTSRFVENSDSDDDFKEELLKKQSSKMTEKIREIVTQRMKSKNAKKRAKSSEIDDESEGIKESEDDSGSSDDESDTETKSSKKTPTSTKKIKKKKKKALTKTERRLQIIQKKRENLIRQAEKERNRIYEVVGHDRDLSSMACGGLPRMARLQFTEPGKDACKGKQDEIDMLAYYPGRVDFELELHNEMEEIMSRTLFKDYPGEHDPVLDMENVIKMIRAQRFNRVLAERLAANRAIHLHGKNKEYLEFLKKVNQGRQKPSEIVAEKTGEEAILCVTQQVLKPEEIENLLEKRQKVQEMMAKVKALQELQKQGHLEYDKEAKEQVERAVENAKPKEKKRKYKKTKFTTLGNKYKDKAKWNKMRKFYKT